MGPVSHTSALSSSLLQEHCALPRLQAGQDAYGSSRASASEPGASTNTYGPHTVLHTGCWTGRKNPDFVLLEKKIKQVFAITLDECYNKVSKATLESKL